MRAALFLGLLFLLVVGALATGCGGGGTGKTLDVADIGWTENTAISGLTKVLLEEELGYEVTIHTTALDSVFEGVADGDLDAFQDVWLPNQRDLLAGVAGDVEHLDPWYLGTTMQGLAVPGYMDVTSIDQLNGTAAEHILGIEPSSVVMEIVSNEVIPEYGLKQKLVEAPTEGMLAEVENRYRNREEFALVAWSPHWMNLAYDFRYLEDPKDAFGELNDPAECSTIVSEDLRDEDPAAYAFLDALALTEEQINDLEDAINKAGDPLEGARQWAQNNRDVWQPWVEDAQNAQEA